MTKTIQGELKKVSRYAGLKVEGYNADTSSWLNPAAKDGDDEGKKELSEELQRFEGSEVSVTINGDGDYTNLKPLQKPKKEKKEASLPATKKGVRIVRQNVLGHAVKIVKDNLTMNSDFVDEDFTLERHAEEVQTVASYLEDWVMRD